MSSKDQLVVIIIKLKCKLGTFIIMCLVHFWKVDLTKDGNNEITNHSSIIVCRQHTHLSRQVAVGTAVPRTI